MKFPLTDQQKEKVRIKMERLMATGESEPYTEEELRDDENEIDTPDENEIKKLEKQK